jgi:hypothetical protein
VNKHKITQDGQRIYTTNTRREQTQHNSRRATYIHNQYLAWTNTKRRATYMQISSRLVLFVYMRCPSWVILCVFTPCIDCVYVWPVLSYFVFDHAKYWLCIYVTRLELFCVCSRLVLIGYMRCPSWVILCLFTPSIDCVYMLPVLSYFVFVYTINTWREQTQNNSIRATQIHNQYLAWTNTK